MTWRNELATNDVTGDGLSFRVNWPKESEGNEGTYRFPIGLQNTKLAISICKILLSELLKPEPLIDSWQK